MKQVKKNEPVVERVAWGVRTVRYPTQLLLEIGGHFWILLGGELGYGIAMMGPKSGIMVSTKEVAKLHKLKRKKR